VSCPQQVSPVTPGDGEGLTLGETDGEIDAETDGDSLLDGDKLGDSLLDGDGEIDGETLADSEPAAAGITQPRGRYNARTVFGACAAIVGVLTGVRLYPPTQS